MDHKFRLGKTIYFIITIVFIIGLLLVAFNSNYILKYLPNEAVFNENQDQSSVTRLSEKTIASLEKEEHLLIYNEENPFSVKLKDNIKKTMEYMKKKVTAIPNSETPSSFDQYKNVIFAFEEVSEIPNLQLIEDYVANGGKLFFAIRPEINDSLHSFYQKIGINEVGEFIETKGVKLTSNVLLKQDGLVMETEDTLINSSLQVGLTDKTTIYMKSIEDVPLLWDMPYKKGKFMVFNGTMLAAKDNRGLITGAFSMLNETFIYPIMNFKVAFIDDFPAPIPEGRNKDIYEEFKRDIPGYYLDIWWPDMLRLAAKYDVKYTGAAIQTYNDRVSSPFIDDANHRNTFIQFGRELLKMGGEIGIHGYNHQSLMANQAAVDDLGYKAWKKQEYMEESLDTIQNYIENLFPTYTINTYVPPSNRIDANGEKALKSAVPSINIVASLYLDDSIEHTTVHEFEKDEEYIHLPRVTSGYEYSAKMEWAMINAVTSLGVFNHFVHPDDVLDIERSSHKNWGDLVKEFEHLLRDVYSNYPWLKSKTASKAGKDLNYYLDSTVYIEEKPNKIVVQIDRFSGEMGFLIRTDKKIGKIKNCTVKKVDEDVYYVEAKEAMFEIGLIE